MATDIDIARAEAVTARMVLAFDAGDFDAYGVALAEVMADAQLAAGVIATAIHTVCVCFEGGHPGWQARTQIQLVGLLDQLSGV